MSAEGKKRVAHKPSHPPFHDLVVEAIAGLHERDGSSVSAIRKFVEQKYGDKLKGSWEKLLSNATKKAVESGALVKQKASYKLGDDLKRKHNAKKPAKVRQLQGPRHFPTPARRGRCCVEAPRTLADWAALPPPVLQKPRAAKGAAKPRKVNQSAGASGGF